MTWALPARHRITLIALGVLLAVVVLDLDLNRDTGPPVPPTNTLQVPLVDEQPVQTARNLLHLSPTPEGQRYAGQAFRLADHAVGLAFSVALREAALHPSAATPQVKEAAARVSRSEAQVKSDQEIIDGIKKDAAAANVSSDQLQQQLEVFQAQLELDKDELDETRADLLRFGADPLSRIQRQFARYEASQQSEAGNVESPTKETTETSAPNNLIAQWNLWLTQRTMARRLQQAREETVKKRDQWQQKRTSAEKESESGGNPGQELASEASGTQDAVVIANLRRLANRQKNLADLSRLVQDHQDLADVYGNWLAAVRTRQRAALRRLLEFVMLILLVALAVYMGSQALDGLFSKWIPDGRRARTMRVIARFGLQAAGLLIVAFVLLGIPAQMPTILGLAGAGLTVVLKDFIVGFFGWFALMGRNGIRVGDWVEIEGVVGEVAEITLLRTVLLETGNWNAPGHPTGRKVAFVNSYAIEGHYFNFSTSGQWLWDELQILLPATENPYPVLDAIQKLVTETTATSSKEAEQEWQRATQRERFVAVSAAPAINLRPTSSGVEIHIRYITRAQERYAIRTKLYQDITALLHQWQTVPDSVKGPSVART